MKHIRWKEILFNIAVWVVMLAPIAMLVITIADMALDLRYLAIRRPFSIGFLELILFLLGFLPTIVLSIMLIVRKFGDVRDFLQKVLLILCIVYYLPIGLFIQCFSLWEFTDHFCSRTENPSHYMQVDQIFSMSSKTAWEVFPEKLPASSNPSPAKYHYCCTYDYGCTIYAEWVLSPDKLAEEINRVEQLLSGEDTFIRMRYGDFDCLALPALVSRGGIVGPDCSPFELTDEYVTTHHLTMFAYNDATGAVRYIYCNEEANQDHPPYYMTLNWHTTDNINLLSPA